MARLVWRCHTFAIFFLSLLIFSALRHTFPCIRGSGRCNDRVLFACSSCFTFYLMCCHIDVLHRIWYFGDISLSLSLSLRWCLQRWAYHLIRTSSTAINLLNTYTLRVSCSIFCVQTLFIETVLSMWFERALAQRKHVIFAKKESSITKRNHHHHC